jgi:heme exporter protein D
VEDWRLFFEMGGYGVYVWSSYGLSLLVLALLWLAVHRRKVRALQRLVQRDT